MIDVSLPLVLLLLLSAVVHGGLILAERYVKHVKKRRDQDYFSKMEALFAAGQYAHDQSLRDMEAAVTERLLKCEAQKYPAPKHFELTFQQQVEQELGRPLLDAEQHFMRRLNEDHTAKQVASKVKAWNDRHGHPHTPHHK